MYWLRHTFIEVRFYFGGLLSVFDILFSTFIEVISVVWFGGRQSVCTDFLRLLLVSLVVSFGGIQLSCTQIPTRIKVCSVEFVLVFYKQFVFTSVVN